MESHASADRHPVLGMVSSRRRRKSRFFIYIYIYIYMIFDLLIENRFDMKVKNQTMLKLL